MSVPENLCTIASEDLVVTISPVGAELQSVCYQGKEYLWQGDPAYWTGRAPNLFPYIARLTEGKYIYQNKEYFMKIHGFVREAVLTHYKPAENRIVFLLEANDSTRAIYPFEFTYEVEYAVVGNQLEVTYTVVNEDNKPMYFGVGGHPGFSVPVRGEGAFEDYYLQFETGDNLQRVGFSESNFVTGMDAYALDKDNRLPLNHHLFDHDAIVLTGARDKVTLKSDLHPGSVEVTYEGLPYLGIWSKPGTDAPYVCIEPWSSLPSRENVIENLETKPDLVKLESGKTHTTRWSARLK